MALTGLVMAMMIRKLMPPFPIIFKRCFVGSLPADLQEKVSYDADAVWDEALDIA